MMRELFIKLGKKKLIILSSIAVIVLAVLITTIVLIVGNSVKNQKGEKEREANKNLYSSSESSTSSTAKTGWQPDDEAVNAEGIKASFEKLYAKNKDIRGWISIPGTKLDLAVTQGKDNAYYLDRNLEKQKFAFGVPFMDYRTSLTPTSQSDNITMYGHAAKDGSFFAPVKEYKNINFYKEHPTITFNTIYGKGEYKVIARFTEDVRVENPKIFNYHDYYDLGSEKLFNHFVENVLKRSYFDAPVDIKPGDKFITLSTCNIEVVNSLSTPYRDVLVARKVRVGEDPKVDVAKVKENTDMIMPDGWIKKFGKKNPYQK
ncbi:class B sortase [Paludicola sp. MB14-C6]|uniref:class B sortase n=1 Tax=Paludihabitans sp. MB14-C6 TaxID=3070656 RepID=UPI0027DDFF6E|nr:class B sortase [Paludicola sp. MB14-C6]WMJ23510.1 class B sortase [Paludicola sp. MB14-C6]